MTDMVERWRLDEANVRIAAYAKLVGDIRYVCTRSQYSSGGSKVEVLRLLDEFFSGVGSPPVAAVEGVQPPARSGSVGAGPGTPPLPVPHVVQVPPAYRTPQLSEQDDWYGPPMAMGSADYASTKRVMWA